MLRPLVTVIRGTGGQLASASTRSEMEKSEHFLKHRITAATFYRQLNLHEHEERWEQRLRAGDELEIRDPVCHTGRSFDIIFRFWFQI